MFAWVAEKTYLDYLPNGERFAMKHLSKCMFAMMVFLLMGFSATSCPAQDEGRLLHAGLLGYADSIENDAILLAPAASGQILGGPPRRGAIPTLGHPQGGLNLRLGNFNYQRDNLEDRFDNVIFYGIGVTQNISDNFSIRLISVDYISADSSYKPGASYERSISTISFKTTALLHPAAGALGGSGSGYFNPYLGL